MPAPPETVAEKPKMTPDRAAELLAKFINAADKLLQPEIQHSSN